MYQVKIKVDFVITDNAANMRKALTAVLAHGDEQGGEEIDEAAVDNPELWQDTDQIDHVEIDEAVAVHSRRERLLCFDHSLHLVVGDGLKNTKCVSAAIAKCCKICSLLHTSTLFSDAFAQIFGANKGIPAAVSTRWNSSLRKMKALLILDAKLLQDLLESQGHKHLILSAWEWAQLNELVDLLDPFLEATMMTEGDGNHHICLAVCTGCHQPSAESRHHVKYCGTIADALLVSVKTDLMDCSSEFKWQELTGCRTLTAGHTDPTYILYPHSWTQSSACSGSIMSCSFLLSRRKN